MQTPIQSKTDKCVFQYCQSNGWGFLPASDYVVWTVLNEKPPNLRLTVTKNVDWTLNFRVRMLFKGAVKVDNVHVCVCVCRCLKCSYSAGESFCGLNVHHLKHMPKCVENWGPLWAHSCFPFESVNGDLLKLFHGTRNPVEQVCFSYMYKTNISNTYFKSCQSICWGLNLSLL